MTQQQAEEFWREWQAFKEKWGIYVATDHGGYACAEFHDGHTIVRLEGESLRIETKDAARRPVGNVTDWGRA